MRFQFELATSPAAFERMALGAACLHLTSVLHRAAVGVRRRVGLVCTGLIAGTPEYRSLLSGELRGDFGLEEPEARLAAILAAIARGVEVLVEPARAVGGRVEGGLRVGILADDLKAILELSEASYISPPSGEEIPWLHWLIGAGDRVVVFDYHVDFDIGEAGKRRSRSGQALMFAGAGWHVPRWAAGTPGDNFLTRAFEVGEAEALLTRAITDEIQSRF